MLATSINKVYQIIRPFNVADFETQWQSCINQIKQITEDDKRVFKLSVFVGEVDWKETAKSRLSTIKESFGNHCPAITVLAQRLINHEVVVELGYVSDPEIQVLYKKWQSITYTILECKTYKELWASGFGLQSEKNTIGKSASFAFDEMVDLLAAEGMSLNHIVRQWNYIPQILAFEAKEGKSYQHYQIFNEVRRRYYNKYRTVHGYPAATGIGVATGNVLIDVCASIVSEEVGVYSIDNPEQMSAYQYKQNVLVGEAIEGTCCKQAPQFERAKLVTSGNDSTMFISGTASIKGQATIGINNVEAQTENTIAHIQSLLSSDYLRLLVPGYLEKVPSYKYLRVYVKCLSDFSAVETLCSKIFGDTPIVYVHADICRDDLLVEIEGEVAYLSKSLFISINHKKLCKR